MTEAQGTAAEKQVTGALMTCSAERWSGWCQGGGTYLSGIRLAGEQEMCGQKEREIPHPQISPLPPITPAHVPSALQSILPKSQCWFLPLINNGISSSTLHSWISWVQSLLTPLGSFPAALPLHITHPTFLFIVYRGICRSLPASLPIWEDISSLTSCQLWLFYYFIFSCCFTASRNS